MKKTNKKGFTIVELVIVIAVIAILAGVLIPTFSGVITKANMSNVQQVAASLYKEVYALDMADGKIDGKGVADVEISNIGTGKLDTDKVTIKWTKGDSDSTVIATYKFKSDGTVESFTYTDGEYTATFDGSKWTTAK